MRLTGCISYAAEPGGQRDSADRNRKRIGKNNFLDLSNPDYFSEVLSANMRSNLTRRIDFALFMVAALTDDEIIQEAPAIVGCRSPSALAHAADGHGDR